MGLLHTSQQWVEMMSQALKPTWGVDTIRSIPFFFHFEAQGNLDVLQLCNPQYFQISAPMTG